MKSCSSVGTENTDKLPLKKARKENEIWLWQIEVVSQRGKFALIKNSVQKTSLPVLKESWIWPGTAKRVKQAPKTFDFKHAITHHNIYVSITKNKSQLKKFKKENIKWLKKVEIKKVSPTSLVNKAFSFV